MATTQSFSTAQMELIIPLRLRVSLLNFLNFFSEYAHIVADIAVFIEYSGATHDTLHTLTLTIKSASAVPEQMLKVLLRGYLEKIFSDTPPILQTHRSRYETDLFLILYKRAIADIRTDLRYTFNLLTEAEKKLLAEALIQLSLTEEGQQGQTSLPHTTQGMLEKIDSLTLPSEPQVIPQSVLSGKFGQEEAE